MGTKTHTNPTRKPRRLTAAKVDAVVALVSTPMTVALARKAAGIPYESLRRWRREGEAEAARICAGEKPDPNRALQLALYEGIEIALGKDAQERLAWIKRGAGGAEFSWEGAKFQVAFVKELNPGALGESERIAELAEENDYLREQVETLAARNRELQAQVDCRRAANVDMAIP